VTDPAAIYINNHAGQSRLKLIASSYKQLTGRDLIESPEKATDQLWHSKKVILAHGLEEDPIFFYGNAMALTLFETSPEQLVQMPSRLSAEPIERTERKQLLARVTANNYIEDYEGVRITQGEMPRRFNIMQATVWNLVDEHGVLHGQAAAFDTWVWLDSHCED